MTTTARRTYDSAFKANAVALVSTGQPILQVARDLGVSRNTLKAWVRTSPSGAHPGSPREGGPQSGIVEAAASGSRREVLVALRTELAGRIDSVSARDFPSHVRLLNDIVKELEVLDERAEADAEDPSQVPDEPWNEDEV